MFEFSSALARTPDMKSPALPPAVAKVARQIATEAYRLTDEQVDSLRKAGFSEDAIFEIFVAAAVGAGAERATIGLAALKEAINAP